MRREASRLRFRRAKARQAERSSPRHPGPRVQPSRAFLTALLAWLPAAVLLHGLLEFRGTPDAVLRLCVEGFLLLGGVAACGVAFRLLSGDLLQRRLDWLLLPTVSLFSLVPIALLLYFSDHLALQRQVPHGVLVSLLPLSLAPLLATLLRGSSAGMAVGLWVSYAAAIFGGHDFTVLVVGVLVTFVTAYLGRSVRKRLTIFRIGFIVAVSQLYFLIGETLLATPQPTSSEVLLQLAACLSNGIFSSFLALLAVPLLETVFKATSDITLLEHSDLGQSLLQRLAIEAPGTYHHSLVVANLSQAAADDVGANALLARVCSYFHDIGKLTKPEFFSENIQRHADPHDALTPSMSTLVILAHVKEGVSIARMHRLPPPIVDCIQRHHGTGLVLYFHHKAQQQLEQDAAGKDASGGTVNEGDFRYPGPKPDSKEDAIIMLADSVEAASRSLEKPTPSRIAGLVDDIVTAKLLDGQLDSCGLTVEEIAKVKHSFVFSLTNMLHGRVKYPDDESLDNQHADGPRSQPA